MNTHSIDWNLSGLAGHDKNGNEISVRELVAALEGYEMIEKIVNMSDSMRDALAKQAAENYRIKVNSERLQRKVLDLESALNTANTRISKLLSEQAVIQNSPVIKALAKYANPQNWANPYNEYGDLKQDQRNVFITGFHGYELAMAALENSKGKAA